MNVFNLSASLTLDKKNYEDGLNQAESQANNSGSKIGGIFKALGVATVAGLGASAVAVGKVLTDSVTAYAEYEQLVGGVQKLYGTAGMSVEEYAKSVGKSVDDVKGKYDELTTAQDLVMKNAANAYRTAGMSTSQYMEQATSLSASLINSLGGDTVKAAEQTDVAMRAIADNYNTFGGDMQMIQGAFQGFAKQNYTMLDNLKLGYGGTKTEMERLIADANDWAEANGKAADLSIDSFSDVVTAIDYIQQKQQIAGTTAREASTTISGSLGMVKAAWQNLLTGMADDNADFGELVGNLVDSATTFGENIIPRVQQAITGAATAVTQLLQEIVPQIVQEIPPLLSETLPMLISALTSVVQSVIQILPQLMPIVVDAIMQIVDGIITLLPEFLNAGIQMLISLIQGITDALPQLIAMLPTIMQQIADVIIQNLPTIIQAGLQLLIALINGIVQALPQLIAMLPTIIGTIEGTLIANLPLIIDAGIQILVALINGLIQALPQLIAWTPRVIMSIIKVLIQNLPQILTMGGQIIGSLIKGIASMIGTLGSTIGNVAKNIINGIKHLPKEMLNWGKDMIQGLIDGIKGMISKVGDAVKGVADKIKNFLHFSRPDEGPLREYEKWMPDMIRGLTSSLDKASPSLINKVKDLASDMSDSLKIDGTVNAMSELHQIPEDFDPSGGSPRPVGGGSTYIINVNQPVSTPDEMANAIRVESQYGLIEGVPI